LTGLGGGVANRWKKCGGKGGKKPIEIHDAHRCEGAKAGADDGSAGATSLMSEYRRRDARAKLAKRNKRQAEERPKRNSLEKTP